MELPHRRRAGHAERACDVADTVADRAAGEHLLVALRQPGYRDAHGEEALARIEEKLVVARRLRPDAPRIRHRDFPADPGALAVVSHLAPDDAVEPAEERSPRVDGRVRTVSALLDGDPRGQDRGLRHILAVAGRYTEREDERGDPAALGEDALYGNAERGVLCDRWKASPGRAAVVDSGCRAASSRHTGSRQAAFVEKP
ncbi:hypothetical protein WMF20_03630 [Sorangium sp. So ce834]|uniref:hypothetical protein n=1 Tax=Sorangium sp. So ce834 TaxID=3133321 RepID=UPI003F62F9AF